MWITRNGEYKEFPDKDWPSCSLPGKGWVPCDPPAPPPAPLPPTYQDLRRAAYDAAGITTDALTVAMWEAQAEPSQAHTQVVADLQAARAAIKKQFPKP
jgi:hypothetical protein